MFDILLSFCVTWLASWHKRQLQRANRQSRTGLIFQAYIQHYSVIKRMNRTVVLLIHLTSKKQPKINFKINVNNTDADLYIVNVW